MRKIIFGNYDTHLDGPWTLASWALSAAQYQANLVDVPGRHGPLDLTAALTDGEPRYGSRTLTATLERSDCSRLERDAAIETMTNSLDGWRMNITLPDDPGHFLTGRVHVAKNYSDPAHAAVTVTAVCDPWRYNATETVLRLTAEETVKHARIANSGRKTVVPVLNITGEVLLECGDLSWELDPGTYQLPDLIVPRGGVEVRYSGTGDILISYREAIL